MILADKIINERKKNGWSQEELAEQLSVSRQSISKWEGAQAIPDLQRIVKMAELFGVSTDYLLKDEMDPEDIDRSQISQADSPANRAVRKVSMEEANEYLKVTAGWSSWIANGVSIFILSPVPLNVLAGLTMMPGVSLAGNVAVSIGITALFLMLAAAVVVFFVWDAKGKKFGYLDTEEIDTEYGVDGMVTEKKKAYENMRIIMTVIGIVLCILSCVPVLIVTLMGMAGHIVAFMWGVFLALVAAGVNLLCRAGSIWGSYEKLLQEGEYTLQEKRVRPTLRKIRKIYWRSALVLYLVASLLIMRWDVTWIAWPVAGAVYVAMIKIVRMVLKAEP